MPPGSSLRVQGRLGLCLRSGYGWGSSLRVQGRLARHHRALSARPKCRPCTRMLTLTLLRDLLPMSWILIPRGPRVSGGWPSESAQFDPFDTATGADDKCLAQSNKSPDGPRD
jgi:hypothetical protein